MPTAVSITLAPEYIRTEARVDGENPPEFLTAASETLEKALLELKSAMAATSA